MSKKNPVNCGHYFVGIRNKKTGQLTGFFITDI